MIANVVSGSSFGLLRLQSPGCVQRSATSFCNQQVVREMDMRKCFTVLLMDW